MFITIEEQVDLPSSPLDGIHQSGQEGYFVVTDGQLYSDLAKRMPFEVVIEPLASSDALECRSYYVLVRGGTLEQVGWIAEKFMLGDIASAKRLIREFTPAEQPLSFGWGAVNTEPPPRRSS